ncbi:HD domain-containing protein [Deltaproteobacteria bacterium OttesenSCG-928-K17]|nr:HD domain-containing protein [Deltaproteobacteria bacterium OttesenSCG-928-K17]
MADESSRIVDFLFEALMLKRTPRTGYAFLGHGRESVAEHSFGVTIVAFTLVKMNGRANLEQTLKMALFHDLAEARTGDLNYMNKRYARMDEDQAVADATEGLPFGPELQGNWTEWRDGGSLEAKLAADADQLDMILELRRLETLGSQQAKDWLFYAHKRLKTEEGRQLFDEIVKADPTAWWFEKREDYWVRK